MTYLSTAKTVTLILFYFGLFIVTYSIIFIKLFAFFFSFFSTLFLSVWNCLTIILILIWPKMLVCLNNKQILRSSCTSNYKSLLCIYNVQSISFQGNKNSIRDFHTLIRFSKKSTGRSIFICIKHGDLQEVFNLTINQASQRKDKAMSDSKANL